jgi:hypothetical protein
MTYAISAVTVGPRSGRNLILGPSVYAMGRDEPEDRVRVAAPGRHPARAGGLWLCRTLVLSLFHAVVVPSGFRTRVQPHRWITTW